VQSDGDGLGAVEVGELVVVVPAVLAVLVAVAVRADAGKFGEGEVAGFGEFADADRSTTRVQREGHRLAGDRDGLVFDVGALLDAAFRPSRVFRTTLILKCEGLSDAQRKLQPIPTSRLSLHRLVRHAAEGERTWFQRNLLNIQDAPFIWADPAIEDREFAPLDDADWVTDLATWEAELRAEPCSSRHP
jgi:hypothetical protein